MASIRDEIVVGVRPDVVWDAVRDVGEIHTRLAPGFVVDTRLEDDSRVVTFGNGAVATELIVDLDDDSRRLAWAVTESPLGMRHYHASLQVFEDDGDASRVVWIADLLPESAKDRVAEMIGQGLATMKQTLESR